MALINYQDYFDFEGLEKAIKDADAANKQFGTSVETINKRIKQSYDDISKELREYLSTLQNFNVNQKGAGSSLAGISKEIDTLKNKQVEQIQIINNLAAANDLAAASINELETAARSINAEFKKTTGTTKEDIQYKRQLAAEYKRLKAAITEQTSALKASKTVVDAVEGSYNALNAELIQVGKELKALPGAFDPVTGKLNQQNKQAVELNNKYVQLNSTLKNIDSGLGNFQRNVGNYGSAFNGLNSSVSQLIREAPNAALNLQTFFLAISNNIGPLQDSITQFRNNQRLAAEEAKAMGIAVGKQQSVFSAVAKSLFSLNSLITVGVTLLIIYGKEIGEFVTELFKSNKAIDEFTESQEILNQALVGTNNEFIDAVKNVNELKINIDLAKQGLLDKDKVLKQYNESIGKTTGEVQSLDQAEQELTKNGEAYVQMMLYKAAAQLALQKAAESLNKAEQERLKADKEFAKTLVDTRVASGGLGFGSGSFNAKDYQAETERIKQAQIKRKDAAIKLQTDAADQQLGIAEKFQKDAAAIAGEFKGGDFFSGEFDEKKKKARDQAFEDAKALLQFELEKQKEIIENDKLLYIFREAAAQKYHDLIIQLTNLELNHRKVSAVEARIAIEKNETELNKNLQKIFGDRLKLESNTPIEAPESEESKNAKLLAANKKFFDDFIKQVQEGGKAIEAQETINEANEQALLDDKYKKGLISQRKYEEESLKLQQKYDKRKLEVKIATLKAELSVANPNSNHAAELTKQIKELEAALRELGKSTKDLSPIFDSLYNNIEAVSGTVGNATAIFFGDLTKTIQDLAEEGEASLEQYAATAISLGYAVTDQLNQASQRRIDSLEKDKERELNLVQNNAAARQAVEERYAKLIAQEKRKQAVNDKINALFQIGINTAVAVSKTLATGGFVLGVPLLPIVIGLGAAQAAVVLAQPLPQFEKGTQNAHEGYAVVDEKGSELIVDRHGRLKEVGSNDGPRITYLDQGDKVFTAARTKELFTKHLINSHDEINIMREMQLNARLSRTIQQVRQQDAIYTMAQALKTTGMNNGNLSAAFKDAVKDIPIFQTIWDENGIQAREKRRNDLIRHRNTYNFGYKPNKN